VIAELECVVLDCPRPRALADFYQALLGGEVDKPDRRWGVSDGFATLHTGSGLVLTFQHVPDLDAAQRHVLALGASLLTEDPRGWRVFADPAGHPFCLLRR
jgi:hypothetical protein